jgi:hypothetical protein
MANSARSQRDRNQEVDFRELDDRKLRETQLETDRPETQEGLVWSLPEGTDFHGIENSYNLPHDEPRVWCIRCKTRRHWHGLTIRLTTGDLTLMGPDCAELVFGSEYVRPALRMHEDRRKRRRRLLRIDHLSECVPYIIDELYDLWLPVVRHADDMRRRLGGVAPQLARDIENVCQQRAGQLYRIERFWNTGTSSAYRQTRVNLTPESQKKNQEDQGFWDFREVADHRIEGAAFLELRDGCNLLNLAIDTLHGIRNTNTGNDQRLALAGKPLQDAIEDLDQVQRATNACDTFFRPTNLEGIARWARWQEYHDADNLLSWQPIGRVGVLDPAPLVNLKAAARGE